jgi:DNA-binding NarL/FixJ family response regulator
LPALAAGATGYLFKDAEPTSLRTAIQAVYSGLFYLDAPVSELLALRNLTAKPLSPRETQILQLLAHGHSSREIARQLGMEEEKGLAVGMKEKAEGS